ncbi:sodium/hydrogen exchanger 4-like [Andrographis paniculata]|uniref:sodium/hydrogen exchanger 4-like n=1 Tax=Andrographis paniculata TaxID=175694 RepID=UPI0021E9640D|nr:sodium/hydrogen exchanger 4-like [Andrographis paniculata]
MDGIWRIMGSMGASQEEVIPITVFVAILCLCLVVGHLLEENRWLNESITAIIIGCVSGTIILFTSKWTSSHILRFDEELFFIYLLPPIIFNAGFQAKKKALFHNFLTIMLFGVVGVFVSTFIITSGSWFLFPKFSFHGLTPRDFLGIGTIFSSTDTVCTLQVLNQDESPLLYSLVFGEGIVNDATSVVLFNAVQKLQVDKIDGSTVLQVIGDFLYLFSTSTALGIGMGLLTSYALKCFYFGRHSTIREIAVMVLMAYLSYMLSELLELSGILTVFFTGIFMSQYAWYNVTDDSRITTWHVFAMMSSIAETFIFLYVGMDALDIKKWKMSRLSFWDSAGVYGSLMFLIFLGRAAFVFPLSALSNFMNRTSGSSIITFKHQVMILWAGLIRGAVSIALAFKQFTRHGKPLDPPNATVVKTTGLVVLSSTVVFGLFTKPLLNALLPQGTNNQKQNTAEEDMRLPLHSSEESATTNQLDGGLAHLIKRPVYAMHSLWLRFDDNYMRSIFGGPQSNESTVQTWHE